MERFLKPRKFGFTLKRKAMGEPVGDRPGERGYWGSFFHYWEEQLDPQAGFVCLFWGGGEPGVRLLGSF